MDQERPQLVDELDPELLGLSCRCFDRDEHIAQAAAAELDTLAVEHGEGQHIGRVRRPTVASGELCDAVIAGESDRELLVKEAQGA